MLLTELFTPKAIAANWEEVYSNQIPYLYKHPPDMGLVLRLPCQRFHRHRLFPHTSQRYGYRRSVRCYDHASHRKGELCSRSRK